MQSLVDRLKEHRNWWILTGAGISQPSGIPTYRNHRGDWLRSEPIQHTDFLRKLASRQRYWARSMVGWQLMGTAQPNVAHLTLVQLEQAGWVRQLVTQNVDTLHRRAGSKDVIDLHGRIDQVVCLNCKRISLRSELQKILVRDNPELEHYAGRALPDGDADIDDFDMAMVNVPACDICGGILKPNVVFFGDNVPRPRVEKSMSALQGSEAVLVIGSSLRVFSGYRFCLQAAQLGLPIYCINQGQTRADHLFEEKLEEPVTAAVPMIATRLLEQ